MKTGCALLLPILLACGEARALDPTSFETILHTISASPSDILRVNRAGQIATLYRETGDSADHLFFYGSGLSTDIATTGTRFVQMSFSNWGASLLDFDGPGAGLARAPLGQAPQEFFRTPSNGTATTPAINDSGQIAFFARDTNNHGLQDAYSVQPDQPPQLLPDLHENQIFDLPLIDGQGRIMALHEFTPSFTQNWYRIAPGQAWENLTGGKLPANVKQLVLSSSNNGRSTSLSGNFTFEGLRTVAGKQRPEVFLWDDATQSVKSILDLSSQQLDGLGNPYSLFGLTSFSDDNALWLSAVRYAGGTEFKYLYRKSDGTTVNIAAQLPAGFSVYPDNYMHTLAYNGDLWLAAKNDATNQFRYFLLHDDKLLPVLGDTSELLFMPVLTNDRELFVWRTNPAGGADLVRMQIVVPEPGTIVLCSTIVLVIAVARLRRRFQ